jgi:hypothetical protein
MNDRGIFLPALRDLVSNWLAMFFQQRNMRLTDATVLKPCSEVTFEEFEP